MHGPERGRGTDAGTNWVQSEGFVPAGTEVANAGSSETTRQTFTIPSTLIDQTRTSDDGEKRGGSCNPQGQEA